MIKVNDIKVKLKGSKTEIVSDFAILVKAMQEKYGRQEFESIYKFIINEIKEFDKEMKQEGKTDINVYNIKAKNIHDAINQLQELGVPEDVKKFIISQLEE